MGSVGDSSPSIRIHRGTTGLDSRCRTEELALGAVAFCGNQASRRIAQDLVVDPGRVGASFRSLMHLRLDDEGFSAFDPLSGFFEAEDGWVRTHANYPWHRDSLRRVLRLEESAGRAEVVETVRSWSAQALEDAVVVAGGIAVRLRTADEFAAFVPAAPLLTTSPGATRRVMTRRVRVLDLTRVIAGPVATRTLAALGMDVLRIDPPALPEILSLYLDSAAGKRSAVVDLGADPARVTELVDDADVIVSGYRPGSLARLGLDPDELAERHPDKIVATLQAWPADSPWAGRRGFDSIVQVASGIAHRESGPDTRPGSLTTQALDHSCGYVLAGAVLHALNSRRGARVGTSLTAAAQLLLALGAAEPALTVPDDAAHLETVATPEGQLVRTRSMWEHPGVDASVVRPGSSRPTWRRPERWVRPAR